MRRRTFLQAAAGIATFPLLPQIYERGIPEWVVDACCDQYAQRYDLAKPFVQRDHGFATDGRIGLRIDDAKEFAGQSTGRLPDAEQLFAEHDFRHCKSEWTGEPYAQRYSEACCLACLGEGILGESKSCEKCHGLGSEWTTEYRDNSYLEREWAGDGQMAYCYECEHCIDGRVGKRCRQCNGHGHVDGPGCVRIDGRLVSNKYFHLVANLPGVRFEQSRKGYFDEDYHPICAPAEAVRFRFEGGVGLLMPIIEHAQT